MAYETKLLLEELYMISNSKKKFFGCFLVKKSEVLAIIDKIYAVIPNDILDAKVKGAREEALVDGGVFDALKSFEMLLEDFPNFMNQVVCFDKYYINKVQNIYEKLFTDRIDLFRISSNDTDRIKGYRLYHNTINQEIQIGTVSFEDNKIEIARGVCNYLANNNPETSNYTIGWHPNFEQLLAEVEHDVERD